MPESQRCGATATFWPDDEACPAVCELPKGHGGDHRDSILGEWSEDDMLTFHPEETG